ncbi:response regulator transcription factor [Halalkalibacter urbisdiaboli]|uniref:response regulator transcription factor n=1 Tax=Halalkalibacter urbisdiaboli TaxID=1960589 RepID=UPI000B442095|nr:response regulator transcription factor [Halalkalibacter urbisdiaboli]
MKRILIIEDDLSIAELQRDYLEMSEMDVVIETRGDLGLQKALTEAFDLLILDLMLPNMNGFDICKQIRSQTNLPILMVSAKKEDIDIIRGLGLGADDYMTKPFSPSELVARVKAHLARYERLVGQESKVKEELCIRGLIIDKRARRVYVNEKEVTLTSKEYDLLMFLAIHPNQVFTKNDLFERIWGMDSAGDIATVTVHIGRIREKIELTSAEPQYIETIWGVGYRFKA